MSEEKKQSEKQTEKTHETTQTPKTKRRNYKKELKQAVEEKNELKHKLLRVAAEFDNYRKRVNQEKAELGQYANAELVGALLPVLDDLDRFAQTNPNDMDVETLHQGIVMVQKKFAKILNEQGLTEMETVGQPFDPNKHDALMQVEQPDTDPDIVVEEHVKGFEFKDKVLRHAKVIVSK